MPRSYKKRRSTRRRRNHTRRQRGGGCGCGASSKLFFGGGATPVEIALAPSNIPAVGSEVLPAPANTSLSYSMHGGRRRRRRGTRRGQRGGGWFSFPDLGTFNLHPIGGFGTSPAIMASNYSTTPVNPSPTDQPIGAYNTANPRII